MPNSNDNDGGLNTHSDATSGTSDEILDATVVLSIQNSQEHENPDEIQVEAIDQARVGTIGEIDIVTRQPDEVSPQGSGAIRPEMDNPGLAGTARKKKEPIFMKPHGDLSNDYTNRESPMTPYESESYKRWGTDHRKVNNIFLFFLHQIRRNGQRN